MKLHSIPSIKFCITFWYTGYGTLLPAVIGMFGGGLIITKFKLQMKGILKSCIVSSVIVFLGATVLLYTCENEGISYGEYPLDQN